MDYCKHGRDLGAVCIECTCIEQVEEMERELAQVQSEGVRKIAQARAYQTIRFGDEHDDGHTGEELPLLAACYAIDANVFVPSSQLKGARRDPAGVWVNLNPFPDEHAFPKLPPSKKRHAEKDAVVIEARIANLAKAGALIAAEIDRLSRRLNRKSKTT